jgi:NTE family protein
MREHDGSRTRLGLVLTGGGARGAYQAGALLALSEIMGARRLPFRVLAGASAGSISATYLASRPGSFRAATRALADLWTGLSPRRVFRTDNLTLAKTVSEWTADLGLGGALGAPRGHALLDTSPLRGLVTSELDLTGLKRSLARGDVHGLAVTATSYASGLGLSFFQGSKRIEPWNRVTRRGVRAEIGVEHVMASSAIPLFFPAACIDGDWYADGCIRLATPLSPAIHMGAQKVLAIAVRHASAEGIIALRPACASAAEARVYPTPADTAGLLLNALFLDALESDVERATRINETLRFVPPGATRLRPIELLVLRPSVDPASLVLSTINRFPLAVRHLFRGLGASDDRGWDLLSYLAFEGTFLTRLLDLGYDDTDARADEIRAFFA